MGITQATGKVASKTIDALKHQPALLAVVIMNLVFIGFVYFAITASRDRQAKEFDAIMSRCYPALKP